MIVGTGVDLVMIDRIQNVLEKHGERFSQCLLAQSERLQYNTLSINKQARWLAKRYAAKEAILKALGTGLAQGIRFEDLVISHDSLGKPLVSLSNEAMNRANHLGIYDVQLSLSDEQDQVIAFAVAQTES